MVPKKETPLSTFLKAPKPLAISINWGGRQGDTPWTPEKSVAQVYKASLSKACESNPAQPSQISKYGSKKETPLSTFLKAFFGGPKSLRISINWGGRQGHTPWTSEKSVAQVYRASLSKACESNPAQPSQISKYGSKKETPLSTFLKAFLGGPKPLTISINWGGRQGHTPWTPEKSVAQDYRASLSKACESNPSQPNQISKYGSKKETPLSTFLKAFFGGPKPLTISINWGGRQGDTPWTPEKSVAQVYRASLSKACENNPAQPSQISKYGSKKETPLSTFLKAFFGGPKPLTISINWGGRQGDTPWTPEKSVAQVYRTSLSKACESNPAQPSQISKYGSKKETLLSTFLKAFFGGPKPLTISINPKP